MNSINLKIRQILSSKFFRFSVVGAFCNLLNLVSLYFFTTILNLHYILSTIISIVFLNSLGFYLNKRYTFKTNKKYFWVELWKYHTVMFSSFLSILLLMYLLVDVLHIWYLYANVIIAASMIIYNFLMHKNWSFKKLD